MRNSGRFALAIAIGLSAVAVLADSLVAASNRRAGWLLHIVVLQSDL